MATNTTDHEAYNVLAASDTKEKAKSASRMEMFKELMIISGPAAITYSIEIAIGMVPLFFLGRLGASSLGGASLANIFMNCTCLAWIYGMVSAIDTLGSQAVGVGNLFVVGLVTQRTMLLLFLFSLVIVPLWCFGYNFFMLVGQSEAVADLAQTFLYWRMPAVPALFLYECLERFLSCRGLTTPTLYTTTVCLLINIGLTYYLVVETELGFIGAPIATTITNYLNFFFLWIYLLYNNLAADYWPPISKDIFRNCWEVFSLGSQGALQLVIEWGSYEISAIFSGLLGNDALAVHTIAASTASFLYMVPLSLGIGVTVLVGNALGRGDADEARRSSIVGLFTCIGWSVTCCSSVLLLRNVLASLYTDEQTVIDESPVALIPLAIYSACDALQCQIGYILRGCGLQKYGAIANFSFPIIGLPCAYIFGIHLNWGVAGVWWGMVLGNGLSVFILAIAYCNINWEREAMNAKERVRLQSINSEGLIDETIKGRTSSESSLREGLLP